VGNLKGRVERLEGGRKKISSVVIVVPAGETSEAAWEKYLAQHPEAEKAEVKMFIKGRGRDSQSAEPPPRPELPAGDQAPGRGPLMITK